MSDSANLGSGQTPNKSIRVMSGMRTSGALHIGHYFGAIKNWIDLQDNYECFFGAMDWHGMTSVYKDISQVSTWNRQMIADWIAFGVDPNKNILFIQSMVPEHLELFMIFANLTPMGWLERVPTWKDAEEENRASDTHNLGRFAYPVLQAADIAVYRAHKVPVGQDQVAHLELSREIVRRFNRTYKAKLPEMTPLLTETPLIVGTDGRKMSKSYDNFVLLIEETPKSLEKRVNSMKTDPARALRENPGNPEVCSVYAFHKLVSSAQDLDWAEKGCRSAGIGCGDCKARLRENLEKFMQEPREKRKELLNNKTLLDSIIKQGVDRARAEAQKTLTIIRNAMKW
ncbi:MAG TPA: tryptophan--tRNA ligase [Pseudobdellovibrionaceae bacterium]|nr:tryptophan--tRNA ligase [Pseudobdellovibrionaceae bacterium]